MSGVLSASGLGRAFECVASAVLDHVGHDNEWAAAGNKKDDQLSTDKQLAADVLVAVGLHDGVAFEHKPAFLYDAATGLVRRIEGGGSRAERYKDAGPNDVCGEADALSVLPDRVVVPDWKNGRKENLPAAKNSKALAFYGLAAARFYGRPAATVAHVFVADLDDPWADKAELDSFDLDSFAADLRSLVARVNAAREAYSHGVQPDVRTGKWCDNCPALVYCPAHTALARVAYDNPAALREKIGELLATAPADAYRMMRDLLRAKKKFDEQADAIVAAVSGPVYDTIRETGIDLGGGKWVREIEKRGNREIDGNAAFSILSEVLGPEVATAAVEMSVSQASIKKIVGAAGLKKALAALEAAGAITRKPSHYEIAEVAE